MRSGKRPRFLSDKEIQVLRDALERLRQTIEWKPQKGSIHLKKRRKMGHLPSSASLQNYENIICEIVGNNNNVLYLYEVAGNYYYVVRGFSQQQEWLVIFSGKGIMETAFPPEDIDDYVKKRGFVFIAYIEEVIEWTTRLKD